MLLVAVLVIAAAVVGGRAAFRAVTAEPVAFPRTVSTQIPHDPSLAGTSQPTDGQLANPVACVPAAVQVSLTAPATVTAGAASVFSASITNAGKVPCLLDVGTAQLVATIYSGDDLVWSSLDCATDTPRRILLDIGAQDVTSISWTGTRSSAGCPTGAAVAAAGTYRIIVSVVPTPTDDVPSPEPLVTVEQPFTVA